MWENCSTWKGLDHNYGLVNIQNILWASFTVLMFLVFISNPAIAYVKIQHSFEKFVLTPPPNHHVYSM